MTGGLVDGSPTGLSRVDATETETEVVEIVRAAHAARTPLRIVGAGTWLRGGRPVVATSGIDVSRLKGITEYVPGDLTLTARAGTTLAEIDAATRAHRQWLPLDPFGSPHGTLGATLATASAGPLASTIGLPRDLTLGLSFVSGDGRLIRGGGRVVKNVAGFDLVRLGVGAWGTIGVVVEATVRLRARAEVDETVGLRLPPAARDLAEVLGAFRGAAVTPLAAELLSPRLAERIGLEAESVLLVRLAGNAASVRAQRAEAVRCAPPDADVPADTWERLAGAEPPSSWVVRFSNRPSELARLWELALGLVDGAGGLAHASLERGVVRCWLDGTDPHGHEAAVVALDAGDTRIFERLPADVWPRLVAPAAEDPLSRSVRHAFDPQRILNPGILGERRS